jgi:hypothetical protein
MEYRSSSPEDENLIDDEEEFATMHHYVQELMMQANEEDVLDTLLILTNVCEARALFNAHNLHKRVWYTQAAVVIRRMLEGMTRLNNYALPNVKLENPELYYDMQSAEMMH